MRINIFKYIIAFILSILLIGCNGGSSSSSSSGPTVNLDGADGGVANGATNVSLTPNLVLQFSEPMDPTTINSSTVILGTDSAPAAAKSKQKNAVKLAAAVPIGSITANPENTKFTFQPASPLQANTKYFVTVKNGAKTAKGVSVTGQFSFTTGSSSTPTVALISPSDGQTGVALNPTVQLQFSEAVQNVDSTNVTVHEGSPTGTQVAISAITAGANNTYTFSPSANLNSLTTYYIVVGSGITSQDNVPLTAATFSFTTADFVAPTVAIISPSNNQTGVSLNPTIQLQFSKAVQNVNSTNVTLHQGSPTGTQVAIGSITPGANNTYTFSPSSALNSLTAYYVVVGSGITDTSGNPLTAATFNFTTGEFVAPTVTIVSPTNNQTGVSLSPTIQLQFSEPVQNVNSTNVTLHAGSPSGTQVAIGAITPGANNTYSFSPSAQLGQQTTFYVVLTSGITDVNGNPLAPINFNFTTGPLLAVTQQGGTGGTTQGNGVALDASGNRYAVGYTTVPFTSGLTQQGTNDYFIAKYNSAGTLLWARQVGGPSGITQAQKVAVDGSGNAYVTGYTSVSINGQPHDGNPWNPFLDKYDTNGNLVWSKLIPVSGSFAFGQGVAVDGSGNVFIGGQTGAGLYGQPLVGSQDFFITKFDSAGNVIWSRQNGAAGGVTVGIGVSSDAAGNGYIAGYTNVGIAGYPQTGANDAFVARFDPSGALNYLVQTGAAGQNTYGYGVTSDSNGDIYLTGFTDGSVYGTLSGLNDYIVGKYNGTSGALIWGRQVGAGSGTTTNAYSVTKDNANNIYLTGFSDGSISGVPQPAPGNNPFIIKYDSSGNMIITSLLAGATSTFARAYGIAYDNATGFAYITGFTNVGLFGNTQVGNLDFFLAQYNLLP